MSTPLDRLAQILGVGPDNWRERLAATIKLTSPEGNAFEAKWIKGPRSKDKKVAIFTYPKVRGNPVQDLEVDSSRYDFTIYFDGKDNDLEAARFYAACGETGTWEVIHPVHGFLVLQLLTVTEINDPVDSGNITEVATSWIEPIDEITLKTGRELAGIVDSGVQDLNLSAADQYVNTIRTTSETLRNTLKTATEINAKLVDKVLNPLFSTVDEIDNLMWATQRAIQDTLDTGIGQPLNLVAQIQQLTQFPVLASNDVISRLNYYGDLADTVFDTIPTSATDKSLNQLATSEASLTAILGAFGQIVTTGQLETRAQAVEAASGLSAYFDRVVEELETAQELYNVKAIDDQYFSQSQSFTDAANMVGNAIRYLLITGFDLKVERRFTLDRARPPIWIAFNEYRTGDLDLNFDTFLESNQLHGDDILLLEAGREVVIYE
jgi:hypothetical protein